MKTHKICTRCKVEKEISQFTMIKRKRKDGENGITYRGRCTPCHNEVAKEYTAAFPDKKKDTRIRHRYGIGLAEFNDLLANQNGKCDICPKEISGSTAYLDHDHSCCSGKRACGKCIRALLCQNCNTIIGFANDNPEILRAAAEWLERKKKNEYSNIS